MLQAAEKVPWENPMTTTSQTRTGSHAAARLAGDSASSRVPTAWAKVLE